MSFSNIRSYTTQFELNKDDLNGHTKLDGEKAHEVLTLHKELQAAKKSSEHEKWSSTWKSTSIDCPVPNGYL